MIFLKLYLAHLLVLLHFLLIWLKFPLLFVHHLINIVTGDEGDPQAVLIRACDGRYNGPGKLTKQLGIDMSANWQTIYDNDTIWIEDTGVKARIRRDKRVGIGYARPRDIERAWRYIMKIKPEKPSSKSKSKRKGKV